MHAHMHTHTYIQASDQDCGGVYMQVELVHLEATEDSILCGARFIDSRGRRFALTAYDSYDIATFTKKSV